VILLLWDPDKDNARWGENNRGVSCTFGVNIVALSLVAPTQSPSPRDYVSKGAFQIYTYWTPLQRTDKFACYTQKLKKLQNPVNRRIGLTEKDKSNIRFKAG